MKDKVYYEFIGESDDSFINGNIYQIKHPSNLEASLNFIDEKGLRNGFSGLNYKKFKLIPGYAEFIKEKANKKSSENLNYLTEFLESRGIKW